MPIPRKSKSRVRAAFVLTASFGASITGCGSSIVGDDTVGGSGSGGETSGQGGNSQCPDAEPGYGAPCFGDAVCQYDIGCGDTATASCIDAAWVVEDDAFESCNPPAPCPDAMPVEGTNCFQDGYFSDAWGCEYGTEVACGNQAVQANCDYHPQLGLVWLFEVGSCTSTAADCGSYDSESLCGADTACRWLAPACAEPRDLPPGACYPIADCAADSCAPSEVCTPVTYDPCWGLEGCEGCTADASVCLAAPGG